MFEGQTYNTKYKQLYNAIFQYITNFFQKI